MVLIHIHTVCPRSSDPFFIVTYYIKWVTTWTDGNINFKEAKYYKNMNQGLNSTAAVPFN